MATRIYTGAAAGLWSVAGNWDTGVPISGDTAQVNVGSEVTFNVDQSGFAAGITLVNNGTIRYITDGTVCYMKLNGSITGSGKIYIGNSQADPIPAPSGATPEVATLAFNGACEMQGTIQFEAYGEEREPSYDIASKTDNYTIVLAGSGSLDWLRAGDKIAISSSNIAGNTGETTLFTVSTYTAATRTIVFVEPLTRSVNQNGCTDFVILISRNILIASLTKTGGWAFADGPTNGIARGVRFYYFAQGPIKSSGWSVYYCTGHENANGGIFYNTSTCYAYKCTAYLNATGGIFYGVTNCLSEYCFSIKNTLGALADACVFNTIISCKSANYTRGLCYQNTNSILKNCVGNSSSFGASGSGNKFVKLLNCDFNFSDRGIEYQSYGIYAVNVTDSNISNYDFYECDNVSAYNCSLNAASGIQNLITGSFESTSNEYLKHQQTAGNYYALNSGGEIIAQAVTVPPGETTALQFTLSSSTYRNWKRTPIVLQNGESTRYTVKMRKTASMAYLPTIAIVDQFADPLIDDTQSNLSSVSMTDSTDTWETLTITYTNSTGYEQRLYLYILTKNASGTVYAHETIELLSDVLTVANAIQDVTDKLDTMLELDVDVYRFTENALEQAGGTSAEEIRIEMDANSTKLANLDATVSSRSALTAAQVNAEADQAIADAALATSAELAAAMVIINTLKKDVSNRHSWDQYTKKLSVYEDDGVTVSHTFTVRVDGEHIVDIDPD